MLYMLHISSKVILSHEQRTGGPHLLLGGLWHACAVTQFKITVLLIDVEPSFWSTLVRGAEVLIST